MNGKTIKKSIILILILTICGIILGPITQVQGSEVEEYQMCSEVDPETHLPKGKGPVYFTHSVKAYLWVRVTDVSPGQTIRFEWFDPENYPLAISSITVESAEVEEYWEGIAIEGSLPEQSPGTWTVKLYIDDELKVTETFYIINYHALIQEINNLQDYVDELQNTINKYKTDFMLLQENYSALITEYDAKQDEYEDLKSNYDTLQKDYDELLEAYNSIKTDESTLKSLRTTRYIMYGTSAAAVILLIVTIYLARKKSII